MLLCAHTSSGSVLTGTAASDPLPRVHVGQADLWIPRAFVHGMARVRVQLADGVPCHAGAPHRMAREIGVGRVAEDLAVDLQIRAGPAFLTPEPMLAERAVLWLEILLPKRGRLDHVRVAID
jgi:hypothetical protein